MCIFFPRLNERIRHLKTGGNGVSYHYNDYLNLIALPRSPRINT